MTIGSLQKESKSAGSNCSYRTSFSSKRKSIQRASETQLKRSLLISSRHIKCFPLQWRSCRRGNDFNSKLFKLHCGTESLVFCALLLYAPESCLKILSHTSHHSRKRERGEARNKTIQNPLFLSLCRERGRDDSIINNRPQLIQACSLSHQSLHLSLVSTREVLLRTRVQYVRLEGFP
jgi:hypothetical protein